MPIDPVTVAALASAATNLGQNGLNAMAQGKMNRKTRKWNEKMYTIQREHNLTDWATQNEYNSPERQMERLRKAGLNPNLIYKEGAGHDAGAIKSADMAQWNPKPFQLDLTNSLGSMGAYMDAKTKEAQVDNIKAATSNAIQQAALIAAQTASTVQGTKTSEFALKQAQALQTVSLETAEAQLNKLKSETYVTLEANERAAAQSAQSLKEGAERILSIRSARAKTEDERRQIDAQIRNIRADEQLKQLDIELKKQGIQPTDPIYLRVLARILAGDKSINPKELIPELKKMYND